MNTVKKSMSKSLSGQIEIPAECISAIKEQILFSEFEGTEDEARAEELCLVIAEVMMLPDDTPNVIKVNKQPFTAAPVKTYYAHLDFSNICHVIEQFSKVNYPITDMTAYLRKALYNSVKESNHRIENKVNGWLK